MDDASRSSASYRPITVRREALNVVKGTDFEITKSDTILHAEQEPVEGFKNGQHQSFQSIG